MKTKLSTVLNKKNGPTITIDPDASLRDAAELLCEHRIGSLLVTNARGELVGILCERDIMRSVANRVDFDATSVVVIMTKRLIVALAGDDVSAAMNTMTQARIRHLPVMESGKLAGVLSIGDLVNHIRDEDEKQIRYLTDYMQGRY